MDKWTTLDSKFVLNNKWMKVKQDTVKLPTGKILTDYFVSVTNNIVLIIPLTTDKRIVMVRQYKHGFGEIVLEYPAGMVEENEDMQTAALRELEEETGYVSKDIKLLASLSNNPSKETGKINVYLASGCIKSRETNFDESEEIESLVLSISEVKAKIASGEIIIAPTIAATYLLLSYLDKVELP